MNKISKHYENYEYLQYLFRNIFLFIILDINVRINAQTKSMSLLENYSTSNSYSN